MPHRFASPKIENKDDLTIGPIARKLFLFFLPIAAGTLFQQFYNAVDAFVVGKYVGTDALAAVGGSPSVVSNLVIGFCTSLAGGASVVISQLYGAKQNDKVPNAVKTSYLFCTILGLFVGAVVILFSPQILTLLKTPEDTMVDAVLYQRIYFSASIFMLIFNMGSGILRAVGNARYPFACLFIGCGLNIVLDLVFVIAFHWGVAGVAWATVAAQFVSAALVTLRLVNCIEPYRLRLRTAKYDRSALSEMLKIGIPSGLQNSMYGISNMILQIGVNSISTVAVASWSMSGKVDGAFWAITSAFGIAITTFVGQNYGAKNGERIRETARKGFFMLGMITVATSTVIMLVSQPVLHLLTNDPEVIVTTTEIMWYFVPTYITWSLIEVASGVLRGIGDVVKPSVILATCICLFRILWVWIVFRVYPTLGILCISYPLSWVLTDFVFLPYYFKKHRDMKNIQQQTGL